MFDLILLNTTTKNEQKLGKVNAEEFKDFVDLFKIDKYVMEDQRLLGDGDVRFYNVVSATFEVFRKSFIVYVEEIK